LVIDEEGEQLGLLPIAEALNRASAIGVDLVEVSPNASPPVCRLLDYGRFRYEQSRREKEARKTRPNTELSEVRLRPKIDKHDIEFKTKLIRRLIDEGDKVRVLVRFRGREMAHPELGAALLSQVVESVKDVASVTSNPRLEGRTMALVFSPLRVQNNRGAKKEGIERDTNKNNGQIQTEDPQRD
jgi:translation initiation factor IF-3